MLDFRAVPLDTARLDVSFKAIRTPAQNVPVANIDVPVGNIRSR
jgi:hypothetical protein